MRRMAVAAMVACALLCGCYAKGNGIKMNGLNERADGRFAYETFPVTENYDDWQFGYVVDTETGVTYMVFTSNRGKNSIGGITPLLNRDGTPVIDGKYE